MDKIRQKIQNTEISICMNRIKFLCGNNYERKFLMMQNLEQYIEKAHQTEYNSRDYKDIDILLNDMVLNSSRCNFYKINGAFDLDTDMKLGTKSLLLKYLESKLEEIEYSDEFNTVSLLLKDLCETEINANNITVGKVNISFDFGELTIKKLIKLLEVTLSKDNLSANKWDLSYLELIKIQLLLIQEIAKKNQNKLYFISIDSYFNKELQDYIYSIITGENIYCFILGNPISEVPMTDILLVNNKMIDMANENDIYNELIMNLPFHLELNDIYTLIKDYLNNKNTPKILELMQLL